MSLDDAETEAPRGYFLFAHPPIAMNTPKKRAPLPPADDNRFYRVPELYRGCTQTIQQMLVCALVSRGNNKLNQDGYKARRHECGCPDQVEVEPGLTEKCEAELSIDHPRDQPC